MSYITSTTQRQHVSILYDTSRHVEQRANSNVGIMCVCVCVCVRACVRDSVAFASEPVAASLANILRPDVVDQQALTAKVPTLRTHTLSVI